MGEEEKVYYKVEKEGNVSIFTTTWDTIDIYQNERIKKVFTDLLEKGNKNIVIDMTNTVYISTVIIASLVFMLKRAREAGGDLLICGIQNKVKEVLGITNLDKVFEIFDTRQKAINRFASK